MPQFFRLSRLLLSMATHLGGLLAAERWVRSVKEECLSNPISLGEGSLRRALRHYEAYYHEERNHQSKDNILLFPLPTQAVRGEQEKVRCRERLGGLLKYYERKAA